MHPSIIGKYTNSNYSQVFTEFLLIFELYNSKTLLASILFNKSYKDEKMIK